MSPEEAACRPVPVSEGVFNPEAALPCGLAPDHVRQAMEGFVKFLGFINRELHANEIERMEAMMMPANFSTMVSEYMSANLPRFCPTLVKNRYHNGHPDLVPAGVFPGDAVQYAHEGIEVKASRYARGWQGHNAEESFLMVFVYDASRPADPSKGIGPRPFRFLAVVAAALDREDWKFAGRNEGSRRTITATVTPSGFAKMSANWVYRAG
jgi:hypothetical protein